MFQEDDIERVRRGWAVASTIPTETAFAFYGHLFRSNPAAQSLFRNDMVSQGRKLSETLNFIVDALDDRAALVSSARDLAIRHLAYGVREEHYAQVGEALIRTLEDLLGADFTAEDRAAWERVYGALAAEMTQAAYRQRTV